MLEKLKIRIPILSMYQFEVEHNLTQANDEKRLDNWPDFYAPTLETLLNVPTQEWSLPDDARGQIIVDFFKIIKGEAPFVDLRIWRNEIASMQPRQYNRYDRDDALVEAIVNLNYGKRVNNVHLNNYFIFNVS